jgi:hypothetical protein
MHGDDIDSNQGNAKKRRHGGRQHNNWEREGVGDLGCILTHIPHFRGVLARWNPSLREIKFVPCLL